MSILEPQGSVTASTLCVDDMDVDEDDAIGEDEVGPEFVFDLDALKKINKRAAHDTKETT